MDNKKIGQLILSLRKEKGLTQKQLADMLGVGDKAVSKWECGGGCPDISLWGALSDILGADMKKLLDGELYPNKPSNGNISKTSFYVCPNCNNILTSTGNTSVTCCGRRLSPLKPVSISNDENISISKMDGGIYVKLLHPMDKVHHIMFMALLSGNQLILNRLYPEQNAETEFPGFSPNRTLYYYCTEHGLFYAPIKHLL